MEILKHISRSTTKFQSTHLRYGCALLPKTSLKQIKTKRESETLTWVITIARKHQDRRL